MTGISPVLTYIRKFAQVSASRPTTCDEFSGAHHVASKVHPPNLRCRARAYGSRHDCQAEAAGSSRFRRRESRQRSPAALAHLADFRPPRAEENTATRAPGPDAFPKRAPPSGRRPLRSDGKAGSDPTATRTSRNSRFERAMYDVKPICRRRHQCQTTRGMLQVSRTVNTESNAAGMGSMMPNPPTGRLEQVEEGNEDGHHAGAGDATAELCAKHASANLARSVPGSPSSALPEWVACLSHGSRHSPAGTGTHPKHCICQ